MLQKQDCTYLIFLIKLLEAELVSRQQRSLETRLKLSGLLQKKGLNSFDFHFQPRIDERQICELETLAFAHRKNIFLGPPGVGKSHLGIGLYLEAIRGQC